MKYYFLIILLILSTASLHAQQTALRPLLREKGTPPANAKKFHLYLLAGQSNMAGRGFVEPQDTIGNPHILLLNRDGVWEIAKDPVHFDKSAAGVGPGLHFAREMLKHDPNIVIGLIPCAAGGSGIDYWLYDRYWEQTQSFPWNNAVLRTRLAMKDGVLKGILWHQGEADSSPEKAAQYKDKLIELVNKFRSTFQLPSLPFVAGELPDFNKGAVRLNPALYEAAKQLSAFTVISAVGFTVLPDGVHIDGGSQREFGRRFAEGMLKLVK